MGPGERVVSSGGAVTEYVPGVICEQWELVLPDFRRDFHRDRPNWERGRLEHCHDLMCGQEWTVYDLGAEHGDFTALYRSWLADSGDVIPVEPMAHYWPYICGTFEANDLPTPSTTFVGLVADDEYGKRPFETAWPKESEGEGVPDGGFAHLRHNRQHSVTTIDMLATWEIPNAIVIDIEGAEWHALAGAGYVLAEHRPHIWCSVHDVADGDWPGPLKGWYGKTVDDIDELMRGFDYDVTELPQMGAGERFMYYSPR